MLPGSWGEGWVPCLTLEPATEVELEVQLAEVVGDGGRGRHGGGRWAARTGAAVTYGGGCVGRTMGIDVRRACGGYD